MRVISWNMGMGPSRRGRGLHNQAWHYLLGLGPDLAFLQEALPPAWVRGEGTLIHGPFTQWGSLIFSPRFPLERFPLPEDSHLRSLGSYLAFGVASLPDGSDAFLASVHAVARKATPAHVQGLDSVAASRPSVGHPRINDIVFAGLEELAQGRQFIIAGDWNIARLFDSSLPGTPGAEFFQRAHDRHWFECVWEKRGEELQTWFRGADRPYQLDHAFCDPALGVRLQTVRVAGDAASELRLSDHAPLILDFDVDSVAMTGLIDQPD